MLVLSLDQLRDVFMEELRLHQLLQDVSIHWRFAARALNRASYYCISIRFSLVSEAILVKGVVAVESYLVFSANVVAADMAVSLRLHWASSHSATSHFY